MHTGDINSVSGQELFLQGAAHLSALKVSLDSPLSMSFLALQGCTKTLDVCLFHGRQASVEAA